MKLNVTQLQKVIGAKLFSQTNAAITSTDPTGSTGYANCTGLCVWNEVGNVGILAHIEAPTHNYPQVFEGVCKKLLNKINESGGGKGSFCIVIFGGSATSNYNQLFEKSLYDNFGQNFRLNPLDLMDMRNGAARGTIGKVPKIDNASYGAAVFDPATKTLYLDALGNNVADKSFNKVKVFSIQP